MHGSNTCFIWKIDLRMFTIKIESYGDILLYFCEIENMKKYLIWFIWLMSMDINLTNMTHVNGYKLDKYDPSQWFIVVDKMTIVNGLE